MIVKIYSKGKSLIISLTTVSSGSLTSFSVMFASYSTSLGSNWSQCFCHSFLSRELPVDLQLSQSFSFHPLLSWQQCCIFPDDALWPSGVSGTSPAVSSIVFCIVRSSCLAQRVSCGSGRSGKCLSRGGRACGTRGLSVLYVCP